MDESIKCKSCKEELIREELEEGNLCFECFEAQFIETTQAKNVMKKIVGELE